MSLNETTEIITDFGSVYKSNLTAFGVGKGGGRVPSLRKLCCCVYLCNMYDYDRVVR